jgi:16S rRNA (guanine527-N7)-methyltransferase
MSERPFDAAAFQGRTGVSRETLEKFELWQARLEERNAVINLVGRSTLGDFWFRHALDSWQLVDHAPGAKRWLDLGAGAGFPGIAIALTLADRGVEGAVVTLVESIGKKADFLSEVVSETKAPAIVKGVRAEHLDIRVPQDVVTARAMTELDRLLDYANPYVDNGAIALFPKGARHPDELTRARKSWTFDVEILPSLTHDEAAILKIERLACAR